MASLPDYSRAADEIIAAGIELAQRGQVPATSGNLSCRVDDRYIAVTVSGADKGNLTEDDVLLYDLEADTPAMPGTASAETPLHTNLYCINPSIGAVLHTHSRSATLVSILLGDADKLTLTDYELLKAFRGFINHTAKAEIPLFANDQDMGRLSALVEARLKKNFKGVIGYLLVGHGLYTWGENMTEARRHIEALEFILDCELELMRHRQ
jgi:methylthioribulose-1-phosphate dehydratase